MAVSRHLGFCRTANSAIRSADPENPSPEPNMEWIGCTVCEIFAFKLYCDLETGVWGDSRSSKVALFDRAHIYSSSIVTTVSITISLLPFPRYSRILVENCYPLYLAPLLGVKPSDLRNDLGVEKLEWWTYQKVKEFRWYAQPFRYNTRVWRTDRRTDRQTELAWHIRAIACCRA